MDKENKIDITVTTAVSQKRQLVSQIGANLGTAYHKVETRECWQGGKEGFENDKKAIASGLSKGFILNRNPKKYMLKSYDILGTQVIKDPITGQIGVAVNAKSDNSCDLFLPLDESSLRVGRATADAVADALKGTGKNFFLNPKLVVTLINQGNEAEANELHKIADACLAMERSIRSAIADNNNKAEVYETEWLKSAVDPVDIKEVLNGNNTATITIEQQ